MGLGGGIRGNRGNHEKIFESVKKIGDGLVDEQGNSGRKFWWVVYGVWEGDNWGTMILGGIFNFNFFFIFYIFKRGIIVI